MLDTYVATAWNILTQSPWLMLFSLFWYVVAFEIPRYVLGFIAAMLMLRQPQTVTNTALCATPSPLRRVSLLLAGHNEAKSLVRCVSSIRQQINQLKHSFGDGFTGEIICVSDGSTDETYALIKRLKRQGLIDISANCELRGGKSAALNLAARLASGDVFIVIDCDSHLAPDALKHILRPFEDEHVGAVAGNVQVGNPFESVATSLQAIEYGLVMMLGKTLMSFFNQVTIVSGAFGAFRRTAWEKVHGMDAGSGEDLDLTLRLRQAGYRIAFAHHALCETLAPPTFYGLFRQRCRWERDAFWIRFRKFGVTLNPFYADFKRSEALHQVEFLYFNVIATVLFPFYLVSLFVFYHELAGVILLSALMLSWLLDIINFTCLVLADKQQSYARMALLPFLVLYSVFQTFVLRFVRLYAYLDELIFSASLFDDFVPPKVNAQRAT
jgi:cellulose synthase/poly-beta-1,6-N-acetylglucosamine synthase-like glycosyltransferase